MSPIHCFVTEAKEKESGNLEWEGRENTEAPEGFSASAHIQVVACMIVGSRVYIHLAVRMVPGVHTPAACTIVNFPGARTAGGLYACQIPCCTQTLWCVSLSIVVRSPVYVHLVGLMAAGVHTRVGSRVYIRLVVCMIPGVHRRGSFRFVCCMVPFSSSCFQQGLKYVESLAFVFLPSYVLFFSSFFSYRKRGESPLIIRVCQLSLKSVCRLWRSFL